MSKFLFNKKKKDGTAAANIQASMHESVVGVAFLMDKEKLRAFDKFEKGYSQQNIVFESNHGESFKAKTYISESHTDEKPSEEYLTEIHQGATDWNLDEEYVNNYLKP